jgi:pullulanase
MSDILTRRRTSFVLWCPATTNPPKLIICQIENGNPATLQQVKALPLQPVGGLQGLWELEAAACGLKEGEVYHYWFEVDDALKAGMQPIQTTDPLAYCVDYRVCAPRNLSLEHPAAVIRWQDGKLIACDPNGERCETIVGPFEKLRPNNQTVIYELPTAWMRTSGNDEFERAVGTFRDIRAMVEEGVPGANFPQLEVTRSDRQYLRELGINALELLPPADSIYARQWGYGTSHYLAPDYELGYPEGHLSPTSNQDLSRLINSCHQEGIRVFLDVVLGFMKDEPYRHIDFHDFYLENPDKHLDDEDAYSSRRNEKGEKILRNPFGASCPRYVARKTSYDPVSGAMKTISPARQHMLTFITRWMRDFQIDGIRMDSVENVANWDFIKEFKDAARAQFQARYPTEGDKADAKFLVVGEELSMPQELLSEGRLDGLWNENFQTLVRAAILGENAQTLNESSFEWTVRKAIDCRGMRVFADGAQAVNYLTSHDVEGRRKERLYNLMIHAINRGNSGHLFNENEIKAKIRSESSTLLSEEEVNQKVNQRIETILHPARLRRIKLAFVCLLTAVGIPMILAGEEFADQHDLFDAHGNVTHQGGKQVDPVNYSRVEEDDRKELFGYVARLVKLRTSHPALAVNDTDFIHCDFEEGKRVVVWKRGTSDPVVVVANFSDYTTPFAPGPHAEYFVPNWPFTPAGQQWYEVTQDRPIENGKPDRDSIFAWEAKVYRLVARG